MRVFCDFVFAQYPFSKKNIKQATKHKLLMWNLRFLFYKHENMF